MIYYYANLISSILIFGCYTMINDYNYYNKLKNKSNKELNETYNKVIPTVLLNVYVLSIPAIYIFDKLLKNPDYHLLKKLPILGHPQYIGTVPDKKQSINFSVNS